MMIQPVFGRPGVGLPSTAVQGFISRDGRIGYWPRGAILDGAKTRDPSNTANILACRPGIPLGRVTASGKLANSILGLTAGALTNSGTSLTLTTAGAAELLRRVGASGTFNLVGPPVASGVVRTLGATYSAINTSTGVVTITALGVNDVQTFNWTNTPAGTFRLRVKDYLGVWQTTQRITYSATIATLLANIQAATDAVLAANAIVWSGTLVTAVAATFSGTNYAGLPQDNIIVDMDALTAGDVDVTHTTPGVDGRFVTASIVTDTDGSGVPTTFIGDGIGILMSSDSRDIEMPRVPCSLIVETANFIDYPADASLKTWVRSSMSTTQGAKFIFDDVFP